MADVRPYTEILVGVNGCGVAVALMIRPVDVSYYSCLLRRSDLAGNEGRHNFPKIHHGVL